MTILVLKWILYEWNGNVFTLFIRLSAVCITGLKHSNNHSSSIKSTKFLQELTEYYLLKECAPLCLCGVDITPRQAHGSRNTGVRIGHESLAIN
jgi:hypothetical protein